DACVPAADIPATGISGIVTDNGDVDLVSQTGPIRLASDVDTSSSAKVISTATVRIDAGGSDGIGSVYQTAAGVGAITALNLGVVARGNVDLCQTTNAITGTFAARDLTAGAFVRFHDAGGFAVGAVAGDNCVN